MRKHVVAVNRAARHHHLPREAKYDSARNDDPAAHPRSRRRVPGPPRAAFRQAPRPRAFRFLRSHGADRLQAGHRPRCPAASAYRPRHGDLSLRGRDHASRQSRQRPADPPRCDQLDDRRPRHRPFRAYAAGAAARGLARARAAALGRAAASAGRSAARFHALSRFGAARSFARGTEDPRDDRRSLRRALAGEDAVGTILCRCRARRRCLTRSAGRS